MPNEQVKEFSSFISEDDFVELYHAGRPWELMIMVNEWVEKVEIHDDFLADATYDFHSLNEHDKGVVFCYMVGQILGLREGNEALMQALDDDDEM